MNGTNARLAPLAAAVTLFGALGCLKADTVNYYSGYSQPGLLSVAAPSDGFGTQNVSFVQAPAPVQNIYPSATTTPSTMQPAGSSTPSYTSSYFQSTSATSSSTSTTPGYSVSTAVTSASTFTTASQTGSQTQSLAYAGYMQAATSAPQTSGLSAVTAAYVSAFGTPAISPVPNVSAPNPLGVSYFQIASALSPLNIASTSSPSQSNHSMPPFGSRMIDIYNPEPGTIALLGGGLGVLIVLRRRILAR
ncbi:MAG TPA: PEP-CTERM sorting domain-containing protein [Bryobacteraceae bacterium]|jgi:hypothetical protein|nr:PEP-CTERM sorting domain-containing protein [Bryobacteraceae bacterium]